MGENYVPHMQHLTRSTTEHVISKKREYILTLHASSLMVVGIRFFETIHIQHFSDTNL